MKKLAIIIDSSSGLTKEQAQRLGFYYLPLIIQIDGKSYQDGIEITKDNLFTVFNKNTKNVLTSATPIGYASDLFAQLSNEYENLVVFPISMHLSGQYQILKNLEQEFPKLKVIASLNLSFTVLDQVSRFKKEFALSNDVDLSIKNVSDWNKSLDITLIPKYNDYLVRGGRLTPALATLAKLLKIVPLIRFREGKLVKQGKGRIFLKSVFDEINRKLELKENRDLVLLTANGDFDQEIIDYYKNSYDGNILVFPIPTVVAIHTGPEAIVIGTGENIVDSLKEYERI
ncbi:DegV family protein [Mycoplasma sp. 4013]